MDEGRKMRTAADCMLRHAKKSVTPGGGGGCYFNRAEKSDRYMTGLGRTVPVDRIDRTWIRRDKLCTRGSCRRGGMCESQSPDEQLICDKSSSHSGFSGRSSVCL